MASEETQARWRARVQEWRASGQPAADFVRDKDYAASTLTQWAYALGHAERPRFMRVVPKPAAVPATTELVVEIGGARIRVAPGFDATLLAQLVAALAGGGG